MGAKSHSEAVDEGDSFQVWWIAMIIFNKYTGQLTRGSHPYSGVGWQLTTTYYENQHFILYYPFLKGFTLLNCSVYCHILYREIIIC